MLRISGARASRAEAASAPSSALVRRNGPTTFVASAASKILAVGVGERHERNRTQRRGVVDEDVEPAERGRDLHRDRVDVLLAGDVADDAARAVDIRGDGVDAVGRPRDESNGGAAAVKLAHQREPESGRAAGDGDAASVEQ